MALLSIRINHHALQEDARRFEVLVIFPVSTRQFGIKDMLDGPAGVEDFLGGNRMGGYTSGLRPTLSL